MAGEAVDGGPVPRLLVALTVQVYYLPAVRAVTLMGPTAPVLVSVTPPFDDVQVALYREIAAPLFAGARNPDFERTVALDTNRRQRWLPTRLIVCANRTIRPITGRTTPRCDASGRPGGGAPTQCNSAPQGSDQGIRQMPQNDLRCRATPRSDGRSPG